MLMPPLYGHVNSSGPGRSNNPTGATPGEATRFISPLPARKPLPAPPRRLPLCIGARVASGWQSQVLRSGGCCIIACRDCRFKVVAAGLEPAISGL